MTTEAEVLEKLTEVLVKNFEIEKSKIIPEAKLFEDLDIDSIDAVDMIVSLQPFMGDKDIDSQAFKTVRTISDVVRVITKLMNS